MKFSLGMMLALCLAGLQFLAVSTVVFSSYVTSERALIEHARGLLSDVGKNTIEHSKGFLNPARGAAELATRLAENKVITSDNYSLLERLLFQQLQLSPQFAGVYYGDKDGDFVYVMRSKGPGPFRSKLISHEDGLRTTELRWRYDDYRVAEIKSDPSDTYDPRARPWYKNANSHEATIWTDPYIFFSSQEPGITVASPVFADDGSIQGVVGVDIEINAISSFLSELQIGEHGQALILDRNGDVIAHPDQGIIKMKNDDGSFRFASIKEIEDPLARAAFGDVVVAGSVSVDAEMSSGFDYDGARYVSTLMPVISEELPWTIGVYAPESDFTGAIKQNRAQNIWIAVAIALASGIFGLVLAKYIHKPIKAFAVRATLIDQGEVSAADPLPKTYKELEDANISLVQAIAARKKSEIEFERVFDRASRGMAQIQTTTGKLMRVNPRLVDIFGYSSDELLNLTIRDLTSADDAVETASLFADADGDAEYYHEMQCVRKDGEIVWVSMNVVFIPDDEGRALHAVVTVDDITETKISERKIQRLSRDLSHSARINMMGQMATSLAHEVNQPLTAITQNTDTALFLLKDQAEAQPELHEIIGEIDAQAHRAGDIIRALRGFVRKDKISREEFDFDELLEQTLHLVRAEAKENGTTIKAVNSDVTNVYGSRVQIAQVLVNLLRNAIEAIAGSDVNFRLITITAQQIERGVQIEIEDTGPGFPPDFQPFVQFETTKENGMGLGLSICRAIIDAHGGELRYDDTDGASRFVFTLPSLKASMAENEAKHVTA